LIVGIRIEPLSIHSPQNLRTGHGEMTNHCVENRLFDAKRRDGEQPLAGWLACCHTGPVL